MALGYHPTKTTLLCDNPKKIGSTAKPVLSEEFRDELRWKTGANPANAGVQTGATSLVFRRGVGLGKGMGFVPLQAQSLNALPLPARVFRAGRGRGEWGQVVFGKEVR